jgi:hypothetical protein
VALPRDSSWRTHLRIEQVRRALSERLEKLESAADALPPKGWRSRISAALGRGGKWMGPALPQLISSVVMLLLALWVKDSVDLAIKQQQLQLSYLAQMKAELVEMAKDEAPQQAVERSAMLVAAFGKPAVMPLINELRHSGNRAVAGEAGLRALAFTDAESVCDILQRALQSPAPLFTAEGLMSAVRTLGAAGCRSALPTMRSSLQTARAARKGSEVDATGALKLVSETPTVPQLKNLIQALEDNIASIESRKVGFWQWRSG